MHARIAHVRARSAAVETVVKLQIKFPARLNLWAWSVCGARLCGLCSSHMASRVYQVGTIVSR